MPILSPAMQKVHKYRNMFGDHFDWEIAQVSGVHQSTVGEYRSRFGIPRKKSGFSHGSGRAGTLDRYRGKKCACGRQAIDRFRGEYMCSECLVPDYRVELNPYSGISPTDCRR